EHWGLQFSRREDGKIYQRPFGGMTTHFGKGTAQRTCAAADRTGHALLHTMYAPAVRHSAEFFIEQFAIALIIVDDGRCPAPAAGTAPTKASSARRRLLATQRSTATAVVYCRADISSPPPHPSPADDNARVLRAGLPLQDMEFVQFHPTGVYGAGVLITECA